MTAVDDARCTGHHLIAVFFDILCVERIRKEIILAISGPDSSQAIAYFIEQGCSHMAENLDDF